MREQGYYWIKLFGEWIIGYWCGQYWEITGSEEGVLNVEEVKENKLTP